MFSGAFLKVGDVRLVGAATLSKATFSITTLGVTTKNFDTRHNFMLSNVCAECLLCRVSLMVSLTVKPIMVSVVMLNAVMLSVVVPFGRPRPTYKILSGA